MASSAFSIFTSFMFTSDPLLYDNFIGFFIYSRPLSLPVCRIRTRNIWKYVSPQDFHCRGARSIWCRSYRPDDIPPLTGLYFLHSIFLCGEIGSLVRWICTPLRLHWKSFCQLFSTTSISRDYHIYYIKPTV